MRRFVMTLVVVLSLVSMSEAQDYTTGVGLRGGVSGGISVKHFLDYNTAVEGIVSMRWEGFALTALYEKHAGAFDVYGLNWFYGAGAHIGFWDGNNAYWANDDKSYTVIGIDGILGLEYNIGSIPFNVSLDWKPSLNIIGYSGFWADGGAVSIRYVF